ncbi:serine hydrolase domain-containing protein [Steroidobacter sp.]|uniref:serine hydrolase domain-containing protein n=1 Tax=Steroidobacter sp. TaxID=1978227 RepID=UPI001A5207A5|nr:serine hydrolase domain-containing protein [Steroidobacter sp.]MBL8267448.1 beta-lactamase family protein [Steroidobacter sp.]
MRLLFALLFAAALPAAAAVPSKERAVDALFAEYDHTGSPGLAVGVYHQGEPVYTAGYGYADLEHNVGITPSTQFYIASVSKQFVAFSAAMLARQGKLDLDGDVRGYLPYVPDFGHRITPRQMIYHTSGLRDQWDLFLLGGRDMSDWLRQGQVLSMVKRQRALNFTPGSDHSYSNTGYTLLAELVEATSGSSLREFTDARIFAPLGMHHTFFNDDVTEIVANRAHSYQKVDGKWRRMLMNSDSVGATGMFSTVGDLLKWAGNFSRPVVGDAALIREVSQMGQLDDGTPMNYGFGLTKERLAGHPALVHSGVMSGFYALFAYFPETDFAVVLLTNTWMELTPKLEKIVALYLNEGAMPAAEPLPRAIQPKRALISALQGEYLRPSGATLALKPDGDGLTMARSNFSYRLTLRADGTFDSGDEPRRSGDFYRPVFDRRGRVTAIEFAGTDTVQGQRFVLPRLVRATPSLEELRGLVGNYRSDELDITYQVALEGGSLMLSSLWSPAPVKLVATLTDRFEGVWPTASIVVERDAGGAAVALLVSSGRVRNLRLERVP